MRKTLEHVMFECLYIFVLDVDIIAIHSAIWQLKYWRTTISNLCQCQVSNVMVNVELGDAKIWRDTWHLIHHPTCTSVLFYIIHRHFCISDKIPLITPNGWFLINGNFYSIDVYESAIHYCQRKLNVHSKHTELPEIWFVYYNW